MNAIQELIRNVPSALPFAIDLAIRATIVLAIVQLAAIALRRASAASRHFVLSLGMVAVVALPLLMLALPDARLEVLPYAPRAAGAQESGRPALAGPSWKTGDEAAATPASELAETLAAATNMSDRRAIRAVSLLAWLGTHWRELALLGVAAIPLLLIGRLAFGLIALSTIARRAGRVIDPSMLRALERAKERLGVEKNTTLLLSDELNVPVVWGVARTTVILPIEALDWSRERLRVVLLHELAHVRRADVVSLFIGRIATALYWFHPLSWIVERDARRECERACDDLVLENGARASEYAHHLLGIAAGEDLAEGYTSVSLAMARPSELEGRLVAILRAGGARRPVSRRFAWVAAAVLGFALLPIATVRLAAKPASEPEVAAVVEAVERSVTRERVAAQGKEALATFAEQVEETIVADNTRLVGNKKRHEGEPVDGKDWYGRGMELHNKDRFEQARAAFEKAIELGFKPGASAYNIACGYGIQGDAANALRWIDRAIENGYDDVEHLEQDSDLDPIRNDPQFRGLVRDLRAKRGYRGEGRDRVVAARERADALRAERSEDADAWAEAAAGLLRLRELDASIDAFGEAIRLSPESSLARYNLSCALALKGDGKEALAALEGAILAGFENREKLENDPDLKSIRGESQFGRLRTLHDHLSLWTGGDKRKDWDKKDALRAALPRFEEAARLYPQAGRAWFNLGFASLAADDTTKARDAFGRSLSLGYRRGTSMYNLACVEAVAGNREAAFEWLRKAEESGFALGHIDEDDDLDSLRNDPRFDGFLERAWKNEAKKQEKKERVRNKRAAYERVGSWDSV